MQVYAISLNNISDEKSNKRPSLAEIFLNRLLAWTYISLCITHLRCYTDDDKPKMTMPKQIEVKVTKPQNKQDMDMEKL